MSFYQKYLVVVAFLGIIGIPVFVLDPSDYSWQNNQEIYWGMISLFAIIVAVIAQYRAKKKLQRKQ